MADTSAKEEVRFDSVEILSKAKTQAESRVKLVRALLEDKEIKDEEYRRIQSLYDDARAEVNSGLDRLLVELETTGSQGKEEPYDRLARRAADRTTEFLKISDKVIFGNDRGLVESGVDLAGKLVDALVDVWKTLHGEKTQRHALLLKRIESLKWREFADVK